MQHVAETLLKALVGNPKALLIDAREEEGQLFLDVHVDPADVGRVIGRQGRTINAVRTVVKAAGQRANRQVSLDLVTED